MWLSLLSACNLQSLTPLLFASFFLSRLMYIARYVLGLISANCTQITADGSHAGLSVHCYHC